MRELCEDSAVIVLFLDHVGLRCFVVGLLVVGSSGRLSAASSDKSAMDAAQWAAESGSAGELPALTGSGGV